MAAILEHFADCGRIKDAMSDTLNKLVKVKSCIRDQSDSLSISIFAALVLKDLRSSMRQGKISRGNHKVLNLSPGFRT